MLLKVVTWLFWWGLLAVVLTIGGKTRYWQKEDEKKKLMAFLILVWKYAIHDIQMCDDTSKLKQW